MGMSRRKQKLFKKANREAKEYLTELFKELGFSKTLREFFHLILVNADLNGITRISTELKTKLVSRFGITDDLIASRIKELINKGLFVQNTPKSLRLNANQEMFDAAKLFSMVHKRAI